MLMLNYIQWNLESKLKRRKTGNEKEVRTNNPNK
jgi:hypothetical protein